MFLTVSRHCLLPELSCILDGPVRLEFQGTCQGPSLHCKPRDNLPSVPASSLLSHSWDLQGSCPGAPPWTSLSVVGVGFPLCWPLRHSRDIDVRDLVFSLRGIISASWKAFQHLHGMSCPEESRATLTCFVCGIDLGSK